MMMARALIADPEITSVPAKKEMSGRSGGLIVMNITATFADINSGADYQLQFVPIRREYSYVAKVDRSGKITAVGAGSCKVYVQTVNGIWKTVKVTVS